MGFLDEGLYLISFIPSTYQWRSQRTYQPIKRLKTGDPLSPFLFIILTEALVAQLRGAEDEGRITGLKIARNCPSISHLLFADDSLFFCKADVQQCAELLRIIQTYGQASGQQLNTSKSSIFFGHKVPPHIRSELKRTLGITKEGGMGMYLGLPEKICGSKKQAFAFIQDRLSKKINSWSAKLLSKGGKEVLIKSVSQALPTYVMSCFLLPQDIIKKLQSAIANFWWSTKQESRATVASSSLPKLSIGQSPKRKIFLEVKSPRCNKSKLSLLWME
ncbi:unnamed protein product [Microthlaspi erraticum]|uniref:Reverse transcriptase domain-containing protein n=1 Tax=Microthlaspi erraticum TaxID=1685480 RepID=A0A6D2L1U0_9BRAS|nr:unnamed protein product [Microthlaspi erraticum]